MRDLVKGLFIRNWHLKLFAVAMAVVLRILAGGWVGR
jgi:hypothetical protein